MRVRRLLIYFALLFLTFPFFSRCSKNYIPKDVNYKIVGASAKDLLVSDIFNSLKIEIQYMKGFQPDSNSINNLIQFLNSLINKSAGILVTQKEIASAAKASYSLNDIDSIEQKSRSSYNSGNQLSVYILITDSAFTDLSVFGVAYHNTSICLFGKTLFNNSGDYNQPSRTKLETTIVEHEFGHLLGLVDEGTPMQANHKDAAHGNHCKVESCLMYFASEAGFLSTGNIPVLDPNCLADLRANGGK